MPVAALALTGCAAPVEAQPPPGADEPGCAAVAAAWPQRVDGEGRASTRPEHRSVAAWGDPAVIARCGVPAPPPTTLECISVDGVDWVARRLDDGMRFTTYGRTPAVEVLVPAAHSPEPLVLPAFAAAGRAVAQGPHRCR